MNKEKCNKYMTLSSIFFLTMLIVILPLLPLITHSNSKVFKLTPSNRMDYINSCYILKPKKPTYFYSGKNSLSKLSKINKLIIPANVAISKTVIDDSNFFNGNTHKGDPFLESDDNNNVDFKNNLTLNSHYDYPLDESSKFIKVADFKHIYQYFYVEPFSAKRHYFVLPNKLHKANNYDTQNSLSTYYINLADFNISYHKKLNLTRLDARIVIGYIERNAN